MAGSSIFADLKMSVESLKSQGNLLSSASGNPGSGPGGKGHSAQFWVRLFSGRCDGEGLNSTLSCEK